MDINTKLGTLTVTTVDSKEYPGLYLTLRRNNMEFSLCLLEVDQSDPDRPRLAVWVWPIDPEGVFDEPIFNLVADQKQVDALFEEVEK